ncbi:hypothetical protein C8R44DRAFT_927147 [Mycena epipterygia]|nr:hypothetical protein C8R44DRAFT_927147 [Mycena epipterygia]
MDKPLLLFGWDQVGGMACQAIRVACKPIGRAWAGDPTQIHAPARNKPFRAGASHFCKSKTSGETMVDAVFRNATAPSTVRDRRDKEALCWTLKSLSDDTELEPFLEAIPDLLYSSQGRRYRYDDHIRAVSTCDANLHTRIEAFLLGCGSELMLPNARRRRQLICLKALWSIASTAQSGSCHRQPLQFFDLDLLALPWLSANTPYDGGAVRGLLPSVKALVKWSKYCAYIGRVQQRLSKYSVALSAGRSPPVDGILGDLREMRHLLTAFLPVCAHQNMNLGRLLDETHQLKDHKSTQLWIKNCYNSITYFPDDLLYETLVEYLVSMARISSVAGTNDNIPFPTEEFRLTCATLQFRGCSPSPEISPSLTEAYQILMKFSKSGQIFQVLFANWAPTDPNLVRCLINFIRRGEYVIPHGGSEGVIDYVFQNFPLVWIRFAHYVAEEPDGIDAQPELVRATYSLCRHGLSLKCHQTLFGAVSALEHTPGSASTIWCIALMRFEIIRTLQTETPVTSDGIRELEGHLTTLRLGRGISDTINSPSNGDLSTSVSLMIQEAGIGISSDFLENYGSLYARQLEVPNINEALKYFNSIPVVTNTPVDEGIQLRLAHIVYKLIDTTGYRSFITTAVIYYVKPFLSSPVSLAIMAKCEPLPFGHRHLDDENEDSFGKEYPHVSEWGNRSAFVQS